MSEHDLSAADNRRRVFAKRFRTELCRGYITTGACPYHSKCMFAHGPHELRTEQQNLDDGLVCESAIRTWKKAKNRRDAVKPHDDVSYLFGMMVQSPPLISSLESSSRLGAHSPSGSDDDVHSLPDGRSRCGSSCCSSGRYRHNPYELKNVFVCCAA